jgi:hypothetical protein
VQLCNSRCCPKRAAHKSFKLAAKGISAMKVVKFHLTEHLTRLTAKRHGSEMLKAEVTDEDPHVTIYWRGRVNLDRMFFFFAGNFPQTERGSFEALAFRADERIKTRKFSDCGALKYEIPADSCFVRLEHIDARRVAPSSDFTIWSRVDLEKVPSDVPAPDYIGVSALPRWLNTIAEPLASFVSQTHIAHIGHATAVDAVDSVARVLLRETS